MVYQSPRVSDSLVSQWRIAVVGSGAVGLYYGGRVAAAGHGVHFLLRSDFEVVKKQGISATSPMGDFSVKSAQAHDSTESIGPCDLVIVALKATSNDALLDLIPPLLKEDTMLLTLQNGLGNDRFLAEHFGAERVLGGLCFVCLNRVAPGNVEHYDQGLVSIGEFGRDPLDRTRAVANLFESSKIDCRVVEDLAREQWRKLVWNVPFNGLSIAAGGVDVSRILADAGLFKLATDLMEEIVAGAAALGHSLPDRLIEEQIAKTRTMGDYKPSSMLDFMAGRAVEVEAIWGEPCRRALAAGADVPRLEMLYALLGRITRDKLSTGNGSA